MITEILHVTFYDVIKRSYHLKLQKLCKKTKHLTIIIVFYFSKESGLGIKKDVLTLLENL